MCGTKIGREDKQNTETYSMGQKNLYRANIYFSQKGRGCHLITTYTCHRKIFDFQ